MRKLKENNIKVEEVINKLGKSEEKLPKELKEKIITLEAEYKEKIETLTQIPEEGGYDNIKELYSEYNSKGKLYNFRVDIYKLSGEKCPICDFSFGYSQVNLDHILPKSKYPLLAITPINLVPICNYCNINKGTKISQNKIFNPYFHEYNTKEYIKIVINKSNRFKVKFKGDGNFATKIKENIDLYKLLDRYTEICNITFLKIKKDLERVVNFKKIELDIDLLKEMLEEFLGSENSVDNEGEIDEYYFRYMCIKIALENEEFLRKEFKISIENDYTNKFEKFIKNIPQEELTEQTSSNILAYIKENLPSCQFVGIFKDNKLSVFQGQYQNATLELNEEYQESIIVTKNDRKFINNIIGGKEIKTQILLQLVQSLVVIGLSREVSLETGSLNEAIPLFNKILK